MARTPASDGRDGVGKSGSPAPRSITSSPAALRRFASCEMAIVADVSRWCRLGERPDPGVMGGRIARTAKGTQPEPSLRCLSLHHALPSLPTDRPLTTEDRVTEADAKAALERGRPVVLVRPPAVEQARDLWELLGPLSPGHGPGVGPRVLVVCADDASGAEWVAAAPDDRSIHAVTGLGRTGRVLKERSVDMLAGAPKDLAALLERAALKLDAVTSVVLAWPEALAEGDGAAVLDTVLGETRDARRIVLSWNPALLGDFLERHARRAPVVRSRPSAAPGSRSSRRFAVPSPCGMPSTRWARRRRSSGTAAPSHHQRHARMRCSAPRSRAATSSPRSPDWGAASPSSSSPRSNCLISARSRPSRPWPSLPGLIARATAPKHCGSEDRKSTRLNSSHMSISYAVFCLKKKKTKM